jgi:hypothetical protein
VDVCTDTLAHLGFRLEEQPNIRRWCDERTGALLRELFAEGTRPTSEDVAARLGYKPLDTGPLLEELGAVDATVRLRRAEGRVGVGLTALLQIVH